MSKSIDNPSEICDVIKWPALVVVPAAVYQQNRENGYEML